VAFDGLESPYGKVERALGGGDLFRSGRQPVHARKSVAIVGDDFTSKDAEIFTAAKSTSKDWSTPPAKRFLGREVLRELEQRITWLPN